MPKSCNKCGKWISTKELQKRLDAFCTTDEKLAFLAGLEFGIKGFEVSLG